MGANSITPAVFTFIFSNSSTDLILLIMKSEISPKEPHCSTEKGIMIVLEALNGSFSSSSFPSSLEGGGGSFLGLGFFSYSSFIIS